MTDPSRLRSGGVAGSNGQFSASRHRVARVDRQIQEHLFDLAFVSSNGTQRRIQSRDELDILADHAAENTQVGFHCGIHIHHFGLAHLLTAESKKLACQRGGLISGLLNLIYFPVERDCWRGSLARKDRSTH